MTSCPCCGRPIEQRPDEIGADLALSLSQRIVFERLVKSFGHWVVPEVLFDALYGADPNGGPSMKALAGVVKTLRRRLADTPLMIQSVSGPANGQRRLVWRSPQAAVPVRNSGVLLDPVFSGAFIEDRHSNLETVNG